MPFYTEKQTEEWLRLETRPLPMPDGTLRSVTTYSLVWSKAESLVLLNGYSRSELAAFALEEARQHKLEFDTAFCDVIACLDGQRRDAWGI